jgi:hypothetical protein
MKEIIIALVLSGVILIIFNYFFENLTSLIERRMRQYKVRKKVLNDLIDSKSKIRSHAVTLHPFRRKK